MGKKSKFYIHGRPRKNSSSVKFCPPIALTLPELSSHELSLVRGVIESPSGPFENYDAWQRHRDGAVKASSPTQVFVQTPVTCSAWMKWCDAQHRRLTRKSLDAYVLELFSARIHDLLSLARERTAMALLPIRYVLAVTEEIGQDMANDVSHILVVHERPTGEPFIQPLAENLRVFHEHALALACAYALAEGIEAVMWQKDLRYGWF